jgi:hypothetical protein
VASTVPLWCRGAGKLLEPGRPGSGALTGIRGRMGMLLPAQMVRNDICFREASHSHKCLSSLYGQRSLALGCGLSLRPIPKTCSHHIV